jgi:hypothetical protein
MEVKGIGSYSTYTYNFETGKISSDDEDDQLFVQYFNGEFDTDGDHLPEGLTGFDYRKRGEIWGMAEGMLKEYYKLHPEDYDGDMDIGIEIVNGDLWKVSVLDVENYVCYRRVGVSLTAEESHSPLNRMVDFETQSSEAYNAEKNSIKIGVGSSYELLDGYVFTIEKNKVSFQRDENKGNMLTDQKAGDICQYLEAFMYFADQKCGSRDIYAMYDGKAYNSFVQKFLKRLGVDTSKEFTVNETKCVFQDGQYVDAEYDYENGMTGARGVYEKGLARYEAQLYAPLEHDSFYEYKC